MRPNKAPLILASEWGAHTQTEHAFKGYTVIELDSDDRLLMLGVTGYGKTHFVREHVIKSYDRVIAHDLHGDYATDCERMSLAQLAANPALVKRRRFRISISPTATMDDNLRTSEFRDWVRLCAAIVRDTVIVAEEAGQWVESRKAQQALVYLATQSRHWDCPFVMVAQRAKMVLPSARDQASVIVSFNQTSALDIKSLEPYFGRQAARLPTLKKGEYLYWRKGEGAQTDAQGKLL